MLKYWNINIIIKLKIFSKWNKLRALEVGVQGHDGGEVHRADVIGGAAHELFDNEPKCTLCWMKGIPKRIDVTVRTEVRQGAALSQPIVWSLTTTCHFCCNKPCSHHILQCVRCHCHRSQKMKRKILLLIFHFIWRRDI